MNHKKGQLSIFLILSVVVLFGAVAFFSLSSDNARNDASVSTSLDDGSQEQVKAFVDSCLKRSTEDAISFVGLQGGYLVPPNDALVVGDEVDQIGVPVYLKDSVAASPTMEAVQSAISSAVEENVKSCTDGFGSISGLTVEEGNILATTNVQENSVSVAVEYPLTIRKGDGFASISSFTTQVPSNLKQLYDSGVEITQISLATPNELCVSCLLDLEERQNVNITIDNYGGEVLIYVLTPNDKTSLPLVYVFAHQYST